MILPVLISGAANDRRLETHTAPRRDRVLASRASMPHLLLDKGKASLQVAQMPDHQVFGPRGIVTTNGFEQLYMIVHGFARDRLIRRVAAIRPMQELQERLHDQAQNPVPGGLGQDRVKP